MSEEDKNIDSKVKKSFEQLGKNAPENLWSKLSNKLESSEEDIALDNKIKNSFDKKKSSSNAPDFIWDNVNKQLNIDKVWKKIALALDKDSVFYWHKRVASIALLLLMIGGLVFTMANKYWPGPDVTSIVNEGTQNDNSGVDKSKINMFIESEATNYNNKTHKSSLSKKTDLRDSVLLSDKNNFATPVRKLNSYATKEQTYSSTKVISSTNHGYITLVKQKDSSSVVNAGISKIETPGASDSLLTYLPTKTFSLFSSVDSILPEIKISLTNNLETASNKSSVSRKKFEIGLIYSLNNTWLFNNTFYKGIESNSLVQIIPSVTSAAAITGNFNFSKHNSICADIYFISAIKQHYKEFDEGGYFDNRTHLRYSKVGLMYQRNILQLVSKVPSRINIKAGLYGGYLISNKTFVNGAEKYGDYGHFRHWDLGVKVALGQEKQFKRLIIGYGAWAEYGLINIFNGNKKMSRSYNPTRNSLIGLYISTKYNF